MHGSLILEWLGGGDTVSLQKGQPEHKHREMKKWKVSRAMEGKVEWHLGVGVMGLKQES